MRHVGDIRRHLILPLIRGNVDVEGVGLGGHVQDQFLVAVGLQHLHEVQLDAGGVGEHVAEFGDRQVARRVRPGDAQRGASIAARQPLRGGGSIRLRHRVLSGARQQRQRRGGRGKASAGDARHGVSSGARPRHCAAWPCCGGHSVQADDAATIWARWEHGLPFTSRGSIETRSHRLDLARRPDRVSADNPAGDRL